MVTAGIVTPLVIILLSLAVGEQIAGPAILEQPDTTVFVDPGLVATVDSFGNLVIRLEGLS